MSSIDVVERNYLGMTPENAEILAINAVTFILSDEDIAPRFMAMTGADITQVKSNITDPTFLVGVLDFLLAFEPDLLAFCAEYSLNDEDPMRAKMALQGPNTWDSI